MLSGGGRTPTDWRLSSWAVNDRCPPVRCSVWLDGPRFHRCFGRTDQGDQERGIFSRIHSLINSSEPIPLVCAISFTASIS
jgi:hypothetical protein